MHVHIKDHSSLCTYVISDLKIKNIVSYFWFMLHSVQSIPDSRSTWHHIV